MVDSTCCCACCIPTWPTAHAPQRPSATTRLQAARAHQPHQCALPCRSKVWNAVDNQSRKGHTSIIHGKWAHEETIATASFAGEWSGLPADCAWCWCGCAEGVWAEGRQGSTAGARSLLGQPARSLCSPDPSNLLATGCEECAVCRHHGCRPTSLC